MLYKFSFASHKGNLSGCHPALKKPFWRLGKWVSFAGCSAAGPWGRGTMGVAGLDVSRQHL